MDGKILESQQNYLKQLEISQRVLWGLSQHNETQPHGDWMGLLGAGGMFKPLLLASSHLPLQFLGREASTRGFWAVSMVKGGTKKGIHAGINGVSSSRSSLPVWQMWVTVMETTLLALALHHHSLPSAAESIEYSITMTAINREIIATQWQWTNLWQPFQLFFSGGNLYHCLGNVELQCAASTRERFYKRWLNEEQRAKCFF